MMNNSPTLLFANGATTSLVLGWETLLKWNKTFLTSAHDFVNKYTLIESINTPG